MTTTREALAALLAAQRRCCEPLPDGSHCERPATHSYDCCPDSCAEHAPPHETRHDGLADAIERAERALDAAEPTLPTLEIVDDGHDNYRSLYAVKVNGEKKLEDLDCYQRDVVIDVAEALGARVVRR